VVGDGGRIIEPLGASTMPQSIMPSTSGFPPSAIDSMSPDSRGTIPPDLDLDLDLGTMPQSGRGGRAAATPKPSVDLESISLDLNAPSAPAPLSSGGAAGKPTLDFGDFTLPAAFGAAPLGETIRGAQAGVG
jgi:pilus assembly protein FimV